VGKKILIPLIASVALMMFCVYAHAFEPPDTGQYVEKNVKKKLRENLMKERHLTQGTQSPSQIGTLSNGTGDGSVTISFDAYGTFGDGAPSGDAYYDPIGALVSAGTVFESSVFFGPLGDFLTTDTWLGSALPNIDFTIYDTDNRIAISEFDVSGYHIKLTQTLNPLGPAGSTFVQTYEITNNTGSDQTVTLVRYLDGDLYFSGTFFNDFGGAAIGQHILYEFDTGDNPLNPTTFVGIKSTGGKYKGYTLQPYYDYTYEDTFYNYGIKAHGGIPSELLGTIYGNSNSDAVTDYGYDVTLNQQHDLFIPNTQTRLYTTETIFGDGSIAIVTCKAAKNDENEITYDGIQAAYDAAITQPQTILAGAVTLEEDLIFSGNKNISLIGGYDCDFTVNNGYTTIRSLKLGGTDKVTISKVIIK
jgi:hypothetical protein